MSLLRSYIASRIGYNPVPAGSAVAKAPELDRLYTIHRADPRSKGQVVVDESAASHQTSHMSSEELHEAAMRMRAEIKRMAKK